MKEDFNGKTYWDEEYWNKKLNKEKVDFTEDNWIEKYRDILNAIHKGKALDLGCGLGQDTLFLTKEGFDVVSADISLRALFELKKKCPNATTIQLDMTQKLPFEDATFDLVYANLSTHYYNKKDTMYLYNEVKRILKKGGYFIGRVNSDKTNQNVTASFEKIEENYYFNKRYFRYFTKEQFDSLFLGWDIIVLQENKIERWEKPKVLWEFIVRK